MSAATVPRKDVVELRRQVTKAAADLADRAAHIRHNADSALMFAGVMALLNAIGGRIDDVLAEAGMEKRASYGGTP